MTEKKDYCCDTDCGCVEDGCEGDCHLTLADWRYQARKWEEAAQQVKCSAVTRIGRWQRSFDLAHAELELTRKAADLSMAHLTRVEIENTELKMKLDGIEARVRRLVGLMTAQQVAAYCEQAGITPSHLGL